MCAAGVWGREGMRETHATGTSMSESAYVWITAVLQGGDGRGGGEGRVVMSSLAVLV